MRGRKRGLLGLAAAVLLAASGCAHGNARGGDTEFAKPDAVLQVTNYNWSDMNVYAVIGSMRERLGTVSSFTTSKFKLPSHMFARSDGLRLLADPIGGARPYLSPQLLVNPGDVVEFRLENNVHLSSALVR